MMLDCPACLDEGTVDWQDRSDDLNMRAECGSCGAVYTVDPDAECDERGIWRDASTLGARISGGPNAEDPWTAWMLRAVTDGEVAWTFPEPSRASLDDTVRWAIDEAWDAELAARDEFSPDLLPKARAKAEAERGAMVDAWRYAIGRASARAPQATEVRS